MSVVPEIPVFKTSSKCTRWVLIHQEQKHIERVPQMLQFSIVFFGQISANQIYLYVKDMFDITSPSYGPDTLQIFHRTMLQCC